MKRWVTEKLRCPTCIAQNVPLELTIRDEDSDEIIAGALGCPACGQRYPIEEGIAVVLPEKTKEIIHDDSGYNAPIMLSAYLWSHFGDLFGDPEATDAYEIWSSSLPVMKGDGLDVGCAVGRLTFELAKTHERVIGLDTSIAFIRKAREIVNRRRLDFDLIVEGHLTDSKGCDFDETWHLENVDFIVADALALPFETSEFSTVSAINLLEKVPDPIRHLEEVDRVLRENDSMFLFSDPFSWDAAVSPPERWLSGNGNKQYSPRGIDTMRRFFAGEYGTFTPPLTIVEQGNVSWKIRKTENLWSTSPLNIF